jgi:hypothetical protein
MARASNAITQSTEHKHNTLDYMSLLWTFYASLFDGSPLRIIIIIIVGGNRK